MKPASLRFMAKTIIIRTLVCTNGNSVERELLVELFGDDRASFLSEEILSTIVGSFPHELSDGLLNALAPHHMKHLKLTKCSRVTCEGLVQLIISRCSHLQLLDFSECNHLLHPTVFCCLKDNAPNLTHLNFEDCEVITDDVVQIVLMCIPRLEHLNLSSCKNITDAAFALRNTNYTSKNDNITDKPSHRAMQAGRNLSSVDISGCQSLTSSAVRHLVGLCGPNLKSVNIAWTGVGCTALLHIAGLSLEAALHFVRKTDNICAGLLGMGPNDGQVYGAGILGKETLDNENKQLLDGYQENKKGLPTGSPVECHNENEKELNLIGLQTENTFLVDKNMGSHQVLDNTHHKSGNICISEEGEIHVTQESAKQFSDKNMTSQQGFPTIVKKHLAADSTLDSCRNKEGHICAFEESERSGQKECFSLDSFVVKDEHNIEDGSEEFSCSMHVHPCDADCTSNSDVDSIAKGVTSNQFASSSWMFPSLDDTEESDSDKEFLVQVSGFGDWTDDYTNATSSTCVFGDAIACLTSALQNVEDFVSSEDEYTAEEECSVGEIVVSEENSSCVGSVNGKRKGKSVYSTYNERQGENDVDDASDDGSGNHCNADDYDTIGDNSANAFSCHVDESLSIVDDSSNSDQEGESEITLNEQICVTSNNTVIALNTEGDKGTCPCSHELACIDKTPDTTDINIKNISDDHGKWKSDDVITKSDMTGVTQYQHQAVEEETEELCSEILNLNEWWTEDGGTTLSEFSGAIANLTSALVDLIMTDGNNEEEGEEDDEESENDGDSVKCGSSNASTIEGHVCDSGDISTGVSDVVDGTDASCNGNDVLCVGNVHASNSDTGTISTGVSDVVDGTDASCNSNDVLCVGNVHASNSDTGTSNTGITEGDNINVYNVDGTEHHGQDQTIGGDTCRCNNMNGVGDDHVSTDDTADNAAASGEDNINIIEHPLQDLTVRNDMCSDIDIQDDNFFVLDTVNTEHVHLMIITENDNEISDHTCGCGVALPGVHDGDVLRNAWVASVTPSTCTSDGVTLNVCPRCMENNLKSKDREQNNTFKDHVLLSSQETEKSCFNVPRNLTKEEEEGTEFEESKDPPTEYKKAQSLHFSDIVLQGNTQTTVPQHNVNNVSVDLSNLQSSSRETCNTERDKDGNGSHSAATKESSEECSLQLRYNAIDTCILDSLTPKDGSSDTRQPHNTADSPDSLMLQFKSQLTSLDIRSIDFHSKALGSACLKLFAQMTTTLKSFAASWSQLDDDTLLEILRNEPDLRSLTLIDCENLSNKCIQAIPTLCPLLVSLDLKGESYVVPSFTSPEYEVIPLTHMPCLQTLSLAEVAITDATLLTLAESCSNRLLDLDLSWCEDVTDCGLSAVASSCTNMRSLNLRCCGVTDITMDSLATYCHAMTSLNVCGISLLTDPMVVAIATNMPLLVDIDLSWNYNISDVGVTALLTHCSHLQKAVLSGLKVLTSKPFLSIIGDLSKWRLKQELLLYRRKRDQRSGNVQMNYVKECDTEIAKFPGTDLPFRSMMYCPLLRHIMLEYSDKVNDDHLGQIVAVCRGTLSIQDYYGQPIEPNWIFL